jgi:hypothetical protein
MNGLYKLSNTTYILGSCRGGGVCGGSSGGGIFPSCGIGGGGACGGGGGDIFLSCGGGGYP